MKNRVEFDLPAYDGLLAGHYVRGPGYGRRRPGGTDDWLLIMTLHGRGRIGTETGDLAATRGSLILLSPGTTHDYGTARDGLGWELLWVHFHPPTTWLEWLEWPTVAPGVRALPIEHLAECEAAFREVIRISTSSGRLRKAFAMNALERLLLLCEAQRPAADRRLDERVRTAIDFIQGHLRGPISLEGLSERAHLSASRFAHLFRSETGLPPRQYILLLRLQRAQSLLLRTSLGIAEIAAEVGMDPFYLSLRFKKETGLSPTRYRQSH